MTTTAQIREAWRTKVFAYFNSGKNAYDYEIWPTSKGDDVLGIYQKRVDFWMYLVRTKTEFNYMSAEDQIFEVEIRRYLENEPGKKNDNIIIDDFVTLLGYVKSKLTDNWAGLVDDWEPPAETLTPIQDQWGEVECWKGIQIFKGIKLISY